VRRAFQIALAIVVLFGCLPALSAAACEGIGCHDADPDVTLQPGALQVSTLSGTPGASLRIASTAAPAERSYSLLTPCQYTDPREGACIPGDYSCEQPPGRLITYYYVISQRVVQPDRRPIDGLSPATVDLVGSTYGPLLNEGASCVDITDLNPPPSPDEVFRYFQTLPLPQLTTRQQPPGQALVGLPVIFFTDSPTTQTFTVDIRGFTIDITATATTYTWHTGDGTTLTTTSPGAPYPHHTITHDYSSGTYTAALTTTWGATFSIDGGAPADVPGTTTTQGPPATFTVVQARTVLTNPYD
jgi:hypothetical protein